MNNQDSTVLRNSLLSTDTLHHTAVYRLVYICIDNYAQWKRSFGNLYTALQARWQVDDVVTP